MNPEVILALICDLYTQIGALTRENAELRQQNAKSQGVRES